MPGCCKHGLGLHVGKGVCRFQVPAVQVTELAEGVKPEAHVISQDEPEAVPSQRTEPRCVMSGLFEHGMGLHIGNGVCQTPGDAQAAATEEGVNPKEQIIGQVAPEGVPPQVVREMSRSLILGLFGHGIKDAQNCPVRPGTHRQLPDCSWQYPEFVGGEPNGRETVPNGSMPKQRQSAKVHGQPLPSEAKGPLVMIVSSDAEKKISLFWVPVGPLQSLANRSPSRTPPFVMRRTNGSVVALTNIFPPPAVMGKF